VVKEIVEKASGKKIEEKSNGKGMAEKGGWNLVE